MSTRFTPLWLQLAALVAATPLYAQHAAVDPSPATTQSVADAGQRVGIDSETGGLRGLTSEEARVLIDTLIGTLNQSDAGLAPTVLPSGARIVNLDGRFEAAALAKIGADGKIVTECVTTKDEAERFLADTPETTPATTPAVPALEEK